MTPGSRSTPRTRGNKTSTPCLRTTCLRTRSLIPLTLALLSGCSALGPYPEPTTVAAPIGPPPATETEIAVPERRADLPIPEPEQRPAAPAPAPEPPAPIAPVRTLVLRSSDAANYSDVAATLDNALAGRYELDQINLAESGAGNKLLDSAPGTWTAAIAIGADAAEILGELGIPTVFCQIFDHESVLARHASLYGVDALPPLELQLASWKRIAADASTVGIIVGEDEAGLAEAARLVAAGMGIELHAIHASSDREALYQFRRLAQTVDAVWLLPNGDILSPRALEEIIDYANHHRVHSIVFNKTLLEWGALLSVTSDPNDVAAAVSRVLDALVAGDTAGLERMTPLTTVDAQLNREAAAGLGIAAPSEAAKPALLSARSDET